MVYLSIAPLLFLYCSPIVPLLVLVFFPARCPGSPVPLAARPAASAARRPLAHHHLPAPLAARALPPAGRPFILSPAIQCY